MSDRPQYEKQEKEEEKNEKDNEKNEKNEKNWEEKWRRDPLSAVVAALSLIWAGIVFLLANLGFFRFLPGGVEVWNAWPVVFFGIGVILLLEVAVRWFVPAYRRPVGGTLVLAAIFIGIGLGQVLGWDKTWPLVLIVIGAGILLGGLLRNR